MDSHTSEEKRQGALWGLYIGDALAMPVHWHYRPVRRLRLGDRVPGP